jgi:polar amino acid transport system substrate-binding protein
MSPRSCTAPRRMQALAAVLLFAVASAAYAQSAPAEAPTLQVYTKPIEPFSFERNGRATGFSIELWELISKELGMKYELHWVKSVGDVVEAVQTKKADIGIAAISITSEREKLVDFSTPFYESGLSILTNAQGASATSAILDSLASVDTLKLIGLLALLLLGTAHLVWLFERKKNPEQFPESYLRGIWESSWWALATILSGGCDAKGPVAVGGRIIGAVWMLICIVAITYFTAVITTIMTVNQLTSDIKGPGDLPGQKVATVKGSTAETYLRSRGVEVSAFETIDGAYEALAKRQVKAVVYDAPILLYHLKMAGGSQETIVGPLFQRQNYGISLPPDSQYRKAINGALLKLREEGALDELQVKWFGTE